MNEPLTKEYIAKRIAHTRELAREKRESEGITEDDVREIFNPECIDIEVNVPLKINGRDFFNLDEKVIERAEREGKNLRFIWRMGSSMFTPQEWRTNAVPHSQPFKFADLPMSLLGNYLDRE